MDIYTTDSTTVAFRLHPIPPEVIAAVRAAGRDASGEQPVRLPAGGGEPLRCCLRDAHRDEALILFGYRPALPPSPYAEIGAVFTHADPCGGAPIAGPYPPEWAERRQILRAYDARGWIHPASTLHDDGDVVAAVTTALAQPGVVEVHLRNVVAGCFNAVATAA